MEDRFAAVYQGLIDRVEPDPARLRRGLQALARLTAGADSPPVLQSAEKYAIPGTEDVSELSKHREAGEET